jgi:hypothetical protein
MLTAILRPVGIASAAILSALGLLSRKSRRARFAYHLTLYAGTLGIMSVWGVVVSVAATLIGQVCCFKHAVGLEIARAGRQRAEIMGKGKRGQS